MRRQAACYSLVRPPNGPFDSSCLSCSSAVHPRNHPLVRSPIFDPSNPNIYPFSMPGGHPSTSYTGSPHSSAALVQSPYLLVSRILWPSGLFHEPTGPCSRPRYSGLARCQPFQDPFLFRITTLLTLARAHPEPPSLARAYITARSTAIGVMSLEGRAPHRSFSMHFCFCNLAPSSSSTSSLSGARYPTSWTPRDHACPSRPHQYQPR